MNAKDESTCFEYGINGNCGETCPVLQGGRCEFTESDEHKVTVTLYAKDSPVEDFNKNGIRIHWNPIVAIFDIKDILLTFYDSGHPCPHPGCLHHVTHACEGCGRFNGLGQVYVASLYKNDL